MINKLRICKKLWIKKMKLKMTKALNKKNQDDKGSWKKEQIILHINWLDYNLIQN